MHSTHIHFLLDRSGSMARIAEDVIGGFNTFLAAQQAAGPDARITLVQFDSRDPQEVVLDGAPILEAAPLTHRRFVPRGGTPLLDATGLLIEKADRGLREPFDRLSAAPQAPLASKPPIAEQILFVTLTDGEENQSRLYTLAGIRERIAERTASGWTFLFLSAGPDAYTEAAGLGIQRDATMAFRADRAGTQQAMDLITERTLEFRRGQRWGNNAGKPQGNDGGQQA